MTDYVNDVYFASANVLVGEARLAFGPGYRLYFGKSGRELVLLLLGGDKGSQSKDIRRAKEFWANYLEEGKGKHGKAK